MRSAHSRQTARHNLPALGYELPKQPVVLVVDVFDLLGAELANLLAPEKLPTAAALARRSTRTPAAAKSRTISAGTWSIRSRTLTRCCRLLLWCFCLVSHNSP